MKLEEILSSWEKDSEINLLNLTGSASEVPKLHSKYWKILVPERILLRSMETDLKTLSFSKLSFLLDGPDETTIARGWKLPPKGRVIVKEEAKAMVEVDSEVVEMTLKCAVQREKVAVLESIISSIMNRSYTIRNVIEHKKFEAGS